MSYRIIFLPSAKVDIGAAVAWLSAASSSSAARWRIGLFRIVENLETDPYRYTIAEEADDLNLPLRELLYGKRRHVYRILFTIDGDAV